MSQKPDSSQEEPRLPESSDWGGGHGGGARSSPHDEGGRDGSMEGTDRPRWVPPGGTQDMYHPWASSGPQGHGGGTSGHLADGSASIGGQPTQPAADDGMWPQSRPSQQSGTSAPGAANGIPPSGSLGYQRAPQGNPVETVAWRHGMARKPESELDDEHTEADAEVAVADSDLEKRGIRAYSDGSPGPGRAVSNLNFQTIRIEPGVNIATVIAGDRFGPFGSSLDSNQGGAQLNIQDQAAAADATSKHPHLPQLGRNRPASGAGIARDDYHQASNHDCP